jgi:hypothetical protein
MSAAQSTSIPSFRRTSARKSRFTCEVSISSTRFFLTPPGMGVESSNADRGMFMLTPTLAWHGLKDPPI